MNRRNTPASFFGTKPHAAVCIVSDKENPQGPQSTNSIAQLGSARTPSYVRTLLS